jgi:predicted acylesterase/phospholipase RssA
MPEEPFEDCDTWEACRATSAATTFFDPITIGPMQQTFADGAVAYNNPVSLVYREAKYMWPAQLNDALMISIGTGAAPGPAFEGTAVNIIKAMRQIVTETEKTNNDFLHEHYDMLDTDCLYRFNVLHKLAEVSLEEYKETRKVADATRDYLNDAEMRHKYRKCLSQLRSSLTEGMPSPVVGV